MRKAQISVKDALLKKYTKETPMTLPQPKVSPKLKEAFTKVANDMGCGYDEIYSMLSTLEK